MKCKGCSKELFYEKIRFYINGEVYCYECNKRIRNEYKRKYQKIEEEKKNKLIGLKGIIKDYYKHGKKPTEIAKLLDISTREVYDILSK